MDKEKLRLTDEEFFKLHEDFFGEGSGSCCEVDDTDLCYRVANAQLDKAIPLIQQELIERIEAVTSNVDTDWNCGHTNITQCRECEFWDSCAWVEFQKLKKEIEGV
jgi:hypothetical protein